MGSSSTIEGGKEKTIGRSGALRSQVDERKRGKGRENLFCCSYDKAAEKSGPNSSDRETLGEDGEKERERERERRV